METWRKGYFMAVQWASLLYVLVLFLYSSIKENTLLNSRVFFYLSLPIHLKFSYWSSLNVKKGGFAYRISW